MLQNINMMERVCWIRWKLRKNLWSLINLSYSGKISTMKCNIIHTILRIVSTFYKLHIEPIGYLIVQNTTPQLKDFDQVHENGNLIIYNLLLLFVTVFFKFFSGIKTEILLRFSMQSQIDLLLIIQNRAVNSNAASWTWAEYLFLFANAHNFLGPT